MDGVTLALLLGGTALAGYVLYSGATQPTTGETDYINGVNNQFDALINSFNPTVPAIGNTTIAPPDFSQINWSLRLSQTTRHKLRVRPHLINSPFMPLSQWAFIGFTNTR